MKITKKLLTNLLKIMKINGFHLMVTGENPVTYNVEGTFYFDNDKELEEFRTKLMEKFNVHPSEWQWVGHEIDYKIQNEGTLEDLKINLIKCLYSPPSSK